MCPKKAAEFDALHAQATTSPKFGRRNAGAQELAGGYTSGECFGVVNSLLWLITYVHCTPSWGKGWVVQHKVSPLALWGVLLKLILAKERHM